ncbi:unnamed protein product [Euphydryas editha]|uniref:Uncharacterized protein n=1 Tax=Euphydryas editha TaxID=104508 RepID=A0AAU9UD40_EUPED|nr:unnamed protein product [Euphydryas editha]
MNGALQSERVFEAHGRRRERSPPVRRRSACPPVTRDAPVSARASRRGFNTAVVLLSSELFTFIVMRFAALALLLCIGNETWLSSSCNASNVRKRLSSV